MENKLLHLSEFQMILDNYRVSEKNKDILEKTRLVLLDGPTSSGRNTVIEKLVETGAYYHIVSDTTRQPRQKNGIPIEQNGREYWFRNEDYVLDGLKNGEYMEAAIIHNQQVSGCNIQELEKANKAKKIATKDIEPHGAQTIQRIKPDTTFVFILPSDFDEWMRRIDTRGNMSTSEKIRRLESAAREFEAALSHGYYTFIINDSVEHAVQQVQNIVNGQTNSDDQTKCRELASDLLQKTKEVLDQK